MSDDDRRDLARMSAAERASRAAAVSALPAYDVGVLIGKGAFGTVFQAQHRQLGRTVAVKVLPAELGSDSKTRERFFQEAWVAASLVDNHIIPVHDYVEYQGTCMIVMEYLGRGTLRSRFVNVGMLPDESCGAILAVLTGLHHAHQRDCVHRDIKPDNVLYGENGAVKLGDFGIARLLTSLHRHTVVGEVIGTPLYLSPEQARGQDIGPPSDLYSTGVLLYELLSGHRPYPVTDGALAHLYNHIFLEATPIQSVAPDVPDALAAVVARAMMKDPADRFASAEEFGVELARAASNAFGPRWLRQCGLTIQPTPDMLDAANTEVALSRGNPRFRDTVVVSHTDDMERPKGTPSGLRVSSTDQYRNAAMSAARIAAAAAGGFGGAAGVAGADAGAGADGSGMPRAVPVAESKNFTTVWTGNAPVLPPLGSGASSPVAPAYGAVGQQATMSPAKSGRPAWVVPIVALVVVAAIVAVLLLK